MFQVYKCQKFSILDDSPLEAWGRLDSTNQGKVKQYCNEWHFRIPREILEFEQGWEQWEIEEVLAVGRAHYETHIGRAPITSAEE